MISSRSPFPYFQHTSLLCTHTLVLVFTALVLPRSTVLVAPLPPQQSSLDKPQYPFLVPITASPVWTLVWLCAGAGACQAWWAGWMRQWWRNSEDRSDASVVMRGAESKLKALRNAWVNTIIASLLFHAVIVLFGAPIASHIPHTYLFAVLVSILTTFVPSYTLSLPSLVDPRWSTLLKGLEVPIERALVYPVLGAFLGAWAGAFPIPLDWDRPWQAWPLTPAYGAVAGHIAGAWVAVSINTVLFFASEGRALQIAPENVATTSPAKKRRKKKGE